MGQHADDILNGDVDQFTGEWLGDGQGFPRTNYKEKTNQIKIEKKEQRKAEAFKRLDKAGIEYKVLNHGVHLQIGTLNLYPTTRKWYNSKTGEKGTFRDIVQFVKDNTIVDKTEELLKALKGVLNIVNDSQGVSGYHQNGRVAQWDEFDEIIEAEALIKRIEG